jgi:hypothetical protein
MAISIRYWYNYTLNNNNPLLFYYQCLYYLFFSIHKFICCYSLETHSLSNSTRNIWQFLSVTSNIYNITIRCCFDNGWACVKVKREKERKGDVLSPVERWNSDTKEGVRKHKNCSLIFFLLYFFFFFYQPSKK